MRRASLAVGTLGAEASTPVAKLRGFSCQRSVNPVGRGIAVSAVMRPLKGTRRMALRFDLLTRTKANAAWSAVPGGDLGAWLTPRDPTLGERPGDVWILNKSVNELGAPAAYRFRVSFRWTGTHGRALGTAVRTTATCAQPELRPDLLVQSIDVQPISGHPRLNLYVATIANRGATAARGFRVQFQPGERLRRQVPGDQAAGRPREDDRVVRGSGVQHERGEHDHGRPGRRRRTTSTRRTTR